MPVETRRSGSLQEGTAPPVASTSKTAATEAARASTARSKRSWTAAAAETATVDAEEFLDGCMESLDNSALTAPTGEPLEATLPQTNLGQHAARDAYVEQDALDHQFGLEESNESDNPSSECEDELAADNVDEAEQDEDSVDLQDTCGDIEEDEEMLEFDPSSEDTRSEEEINAIRYEIAELEQEVQIGKQYRIVDRLGEGTFSSVYKAIDCKHAFYNNRKWAPPKTTSDVQRVLRQSTSGFESSEAATDLSLSRTRSRTASTGPTRGHKRSASSLSQTPYGRMMLARKALKSVSEEHAEGARPSKVYVALKRIYVTSSPTRIWNELDILRDLRSARNTAYLISAIRHEDQVIAVMPYEKHQDFRTYYRQMPVWQLQAYLKCLFAALADCHDLGVMHRDVKPANFLFDINTNRGTLCDFGLAQRYHPSEWTGRCLHSQPELYLNQFEDEMPVSKSERVHGKRLTRPIDTLTQLRAQKERYDTACYHLGLTEEGEEPYYELSGIHSAFVPNARFERELKKRIEKDQWEERWCAVSRPPPGRRIGYLKPEHDKRPQIRANRAGTRGFRAPEVVLKCPDQTMALDIWSVGVTMLCILTRRFPFFTSNDDTEALMEIAAIFGKKKMEKCAAMHNRTFLTNIPAFEKPAYDSLHYLVQALNPNIFVEMMPESALSHFSKEQQVAMLESPDFVANLDLKGWYKGTKLFLAIELMKHCLDLDLTKRITAHDALKDPFLVDYELPRL